MTNYSFKSDFNIFTFFVVQHFLLILEHQGRFPKINMELGDQVNIVAGGRPEGILELISSLGPGDDQQESQELVEREGEGHSDVDPQTSCGSVRVMENVLSSEQPHGEPADDTEPDSLQYQVRRKVSRGTNLHN